MTQYQDLKPELVRPAADRFVENALRSDDSLFTPGQPIWSLANLDDLHHRFVEKPDLSSDTFLVKFERQLAGAPAATIQLAAECLYVYFLVPHRTRIETKRENVETVLSWSPEPVAVPAERAPHTRHPVEPHELPQHGPRPRVGAVLQVHAVSECLPTDRRAAAGRRARRGSRSIGKRRIATLSRRTGKAEVCCRRNRTDETK